VYVFSVVAAGVSPAVEPGILPAGTSPRIPERSPNNRGVLFRAARCRPLRQPGWPPLR